MLEPPPSHALRNGREEDAAAAAGAHPGLKKAARISLKLLFGALLILILIFFSSGEVDFVYKGF